jgi:hypothetical protein
VKGRSSGMYYRALHSEMDMFVGVAITQLTQHTQFKDTRVVCRMFVR